MKCSNQRKKKITTTLSQLYVHCKFALMNGIPSKELLVTTFDSDDDDGGGNDLTILCHDVKVLLTPKNVFRLINFTYVE